MSNLLALIGYSGHAFVICDIFLSQGSKPNIFFDNEDKVINPYQLKYRGSENSDEALEILKNSEYFVAIGNNHIRRSIIEKLQTKISKKPTNAIHKNASVSGKAKVGKGVMIGDGTIINACSVIGNGVICNTRSVIEHECKVGAYSHIAPSATLCGAVNIGENTFVGAGAVIKQGVNIGDNVTIGAGTIVIANIPNNCKVVGNPQRII